MSAAKKSHRHAPDWLILSIACVAQFMVVLDVSVVNVALPHMQASLGAASDTVTWVLTSYLVSNAIVLPITGWLAHYFGRKRLLMMSVTGFTVS